MNEADYASGRETGEMTVKFKRLTETATIPKFAHEGDSGMDVCSDESLSILPNSWALVNTNVAAVIPKGFEIQVRGRSGLQCKRGILCAVGTVDEGYRGGISVALYNLSSDVFLIEPGDRIAQLVLASVSRPEIEEIEEIDTNTMRGASGFGSTGMKGL